ncbi:hypothetical protein AAG570_011896 [Ranatra chinensis]|uniref:Endonuclease/exonuclease/phosphatase domain-containing protein n=1 Tax=Ranatra chinensis TaxID=642074 RepID=A0ABD0YJ99_9HEMI
MRNTTRGDAENLTKRVKLHEHYLINDYVILAPDCPTHLASNGLTDIFISHNQGHMMFLELFSSRGTVIAAGDFNARHRLWGCQKKNKSGGVLYDFVMDRRAALVAPSNPTCVPCNGGTPSTFDLVLTNSHKCITDMRTVTEEGSGHLPVLFNIWGRAEAKEKRLIFNFAQTDWDMFRWSLDQNIPTACPLLDTPTRIEAAVESLTWEINEAILISTPIKRQLPPRVNLLKEIVKLIQLKNAVRRRWQSQRREEYKKMMNQLERTVKDKIDEWKTQRWNKMLQNTTTRDNTFWNLLRRLTDNAGEPTPLFETGARWSRFATNPEKATLLAKYFSGVNNQSTRGNRSFIERVDVQSGFRRKYSTTHQLSRVVSHVSEHMKSGQATAMVSLDCEKAYDTVRTNGLLFRLTEYKFPISLIKLV